MLDMRIGTRLALTFGLIMLLLVGMVGFTVVQVNRLSEIDRNMNTRIVPLVTTAPDIVQEHLRQSTGLRSYVISGEERYLEDYRTGVANARWAPTECVL